MKRAVSAPAQPEDTDMDSFSEDNTHCHGPPAHIAARFYRNAANARRKSSAHSSRRSSLSSLHSCQSGLSCHGGPRSTHVAQHLRRASIIESRKARLQDRAVHAEQVRLRAAIAKATPRAPYREERALAAQIAREKMLADITARCEEEVRRAKKVAEETKEKKAAEIARLKAEMAEKSAEAARRRSTYQQGMRRPRTTSLPAVEEKKISPAVLKRLTEGAAAKVVQRAWRRHRRRAALTAFSNLDLNLRRVKGMTFEDMTKLLGDENVAKSTRSLLRTLGMLPSNEEELGDRGTIRVFLSGYMILGHPVEAFSHGGKEPQEQELMAKAQKMLEELEDCMKRELSMRPTKSSTDRVETDKLPFFFNDYTSSFHAWKSQDLGVIIDVMVNSFVNLDMILQTTKDDTDGNVAAEYFHAVRQEQIKLLARLKKLAGSDHALDLIRKAVRKARKARALKVRRVSEDNVPRTSAGTGSTTAPRPPVELAGPQASNEEAALEPSFVSQLGQTMTILPSNREIAHEIQINGTYEVQQQPWTESRKHFVDALRTSMRESMEGGDNQAATSWTHAMAILIRDKLLNLITTKHPLYDRIEGFLDPKIIEQTARNGMFSYSDFFRTIGGYISQICSPGRDEAVKAFIEDTTSDTIDRLFALIDIIDLMTLDHINFQFRLASASVVEHGHQHEQSCFQQDLQDGKHGLEQTKAWWQSSRSVLVTPTNTAPHGNAIYARGIVDLVFSNIHLRFDDVPETLSLDYIRLLTLRARGLQIAATASTLLTTKIRLRRNRESLWTKDAERLMAQDLLSTDATRIVSIIESSHMMPEATRTGLLDFVNRVLPPATIAVRNVATASTAKTVAIQAHHPFDPSNIIDTADTENGGDVFSEQIATFVLKSLREHIFARLAAVSTAEKVRVTTSAAEVLARAGMPEFVGEVGGLVESLERIRAVDLRAHFMHYDGIAEA
jgi:hypothetical protein